MDERGRSKLWAGKSRIALGTPRSSKSGLLDMTDGSFIPLANTFLIKAMSSVLTKSSLDPSLRPPQSAIQLIAMTSNGDLRSAINSLQLLCARELGGKGKKRKAMHQEGGPKKKGKGSRGGKGAKLDLSDDLRAV